MSSVDDGVRSGEGDRTGLFRSLRRDPRHAGEIVLLAVLPEMAPQAERWVARTRAKHPGIGPEGLVARARREALKRARIDGAVTGSSFYIGLPPAVASVYCHQVLLVLQVAAIYGWDPGAAERAAEILVLQGRYPDVGSAAVELRQAGTRRPRERGPRIGLWRALAQAVGQVPGMIGLRFSRLRGEGRVGVALKVAEAVALVVPVLGIVAWAAAYARTMRKLGEAALDRYGGGPTDTPDPRGPGADPVFRLPAPARRRTRVLLTVGLVVGAVLLALALALGPFVTHRLGVRHLVRVGFAELFLAVTFGRILWITRLAGPPA